MTTLAFIVASTLKGEIGYKNAIPWSLEGDLKRFKEITLGHPVIMGTNTYNSLNMPAGLPGRYNIVVGKTHIARNIGCDPDKIIFVKDIESALFVVHSRKPEKAFFIGGREIYDYAYNLCDEAYITVVHKTAPRYDTTLKQPLDMTNWNLAEDPVTIYYYDQETFLKIPSHTYLHYVRGE